MDPKKRAAEEAVTLIQPGTKVGLGDGSTIAHLVDLVAGAVSEGLLVEVYSSSPRTAALLASKKIPVEDTGATARVDLYIDGCDQLDHQLNALKSGGGIHTDEKLLAAMADVFVLLGDASKYVPRLDTRFPVVTELLPEASAFVLSRVRRHYPASTAALRRDEHGNPRTTRHGNYLAETSGGLRHGLVCKK